jgi:hypothetical protein
MMTDVLGVAGRFVASHYSAAQGAILGGSRARGDESSGSDYDIVMLFESLQNGAWREMVEFEGQHIEVFAHDLATLAYFCHAVDRPSGIPALPVMVAEGVVVLSRSPTALTAAREIAAETLRLGPPPLDKTNLRTRRFTISELAVLLRLDCDRHVLLAAGSSLYTLLADFALRAADRWSASGKALPRALTTMDSALATRFETAFTALFTMGDVVPVQSLVDTVLAPYGGRLRGGYLMRAPAEWREG